jgi:hypothetical protein
LYPIGKVPKEGFPMEIPKITRRRGIVFYLQIAAAIVSLLLGITQMTKESVPFVDKIKQNQQQNEIAKKQREAQSKATKIASMNIQWNYRGNDGVWRYYSDMNNFYWCRVNIQGVYEYSENPYHQASNPKSYY